MHDGEVDVWRAHGELGEPPVVTSSVGHSQLSHGGAVEDLDYLAGLDVHPPMVGRAQHFRHRGPSRTGVEWLYVVMDDVREERLHEVTRAWLRAADRLTAATEDAVTDPDAYAVVLELAEETSLARLRLNRALIELGWAPPASVRELDRP